jgi:hypothetical protein
MHNRIATEATMENDKIETIKMRLAGGEEVEVQALCVDVRVPKNAKEYTRENQSLPKEDIPSLWDDVDRGQVRWGSVDFTPLEIVEYKNGKGDLIRVEFPKWRLNFFSLLKTKPGQDSSYFLNVRSKHINTETENQKMSKYKAEDTVRIIQEIKIDKVETINDQSVYTVRVGDTELVLDETSLVTLQVPEIENIEAKNAGKRAYASACVKRQSDGMLGVVTKTVKEQNADGADTETVTILTTDNATYTVDGSKVSWEIEDGVEWVYAEMGDLLVFLIAQKSTTTNRSAPDSEDEPNDLDIANLRIAQLEKDLEVKTKLLNSPENKPDDPKTRSVDPISQKGEGAADQVNDEEDEIEKEFHRINHKIKNKKF